MSEVKTFTLRRDNKPGLRFEGWHLGTHIFYVDHTGIKFEVGYDKRKQVNWNLYKTVGNKYVCEVICIGRNYTTNEVHYYLDINDVFKYFGDDEDAIKLYSNSGIEYVEEID